mgnify:CR=1 FL=1
MYGKKKKKYLKGGQAKLDMNKDGKLSGADFKMLGNKNKKMMMGGKMNADKEFMGGGKMPKFKSFFQNSYNSNDTDKMMPKSFFSGPGVGIEDLGSKNKKKRRKKKMMKGGKMNYGSGGYHQHD